MNVIQVIMLLIGLGHAISIMVIDRVLEKREVGTDTRKLVIKCEISLGVFVLLLMSCLLWQYSLLV